MKWLTIDNKRFLGVIIALSAIAIVGIFLWLSGGDNGNRSTYSKFKHLDIARPQGDFRLWINSYPEGAEAILNDSSFGTTPLSVDSLQAGEYRLKLRLLRCLDIDTAFVLPEEGGLELPPFIFEKIIRLESVPTGASIRINGEDISHVTPYILQWSTADTFNLAYSYSGMESIGISAVDPVAGKGNIPVGQYWETIRDSLPVVDRLIGYFQQQVTINTIPTSAEILIADTDSLIGLSGEAVNLLCGDRTYRLRKPGFNERKIRLNVTPQSNKQYRFELTRNLCVNAFALDGPSDIDINATVVKADKGIQVTFIDLITPSIVVLPGAEQRIYLEAEGFADTSVVISADQTSLAVGMRRLIDETEESDIAKSAASEGKGLVEFFVRNRHEKQALAGVEIIAKIKSEDRTVFLGATDSTGLFRQNLSPGKYEFKFLADGYKSSKKNYKVREGKAKRFDVSLKKK